MIRQKAIEKIKNKELGTSDIMCAFDIIGQEYLMGEASYMNNFDDITNLIADFELEPNEILLYMLENQEYNSQDLFITFDGQKLASYKDIDYYVYWICEKMNDECAEFILNL